MTNLVKATIEKINNFKDIDELHDYITYELDLNQFTDDEFLEVWRHMNKFDK